MASSQLAVLLQQMENATTADLRNKGIGDTDIPQIVAWLSRNTTVEKVLLDDNHIGDEGADALAKGLANNTTLKLLGLYNNHVGKESFRNLQQTFKGQLWWGYVSPLRPNSDNNRQSPAQVTPTHPPFSKQHTIRVAIRMIVLQPHSVDKMFQNSSMSCGQPVTGCISVCLKFQGGVVEPPQWPPLSWRCCSNEWRMQQPPT